MGWLKATLLLMASILIASCDDILQSDEDRRLGVIAFFGDTAEIELPDTVHPAISFDVAIRTFAGSCDRMGPTKTSGEEDVFVDVKPYDFVYTGPKACDDILVTFDHRVNIVMMKPGVVEFRFHGRQLPDGSQMTLFRQVIVR